jgi:hypothetical protein
VIPAKRLYFMGLGFLAVAVSCVVVGLLRRHSVEDAVGSVEGAYLNHSSGGAAYSFGGDLLDPFHPLNAYLWVGAGAAFAVAAITLLVIARISRR